MSRAATEIAQIIKRIVGGEWAPTIDSAPPVVELREWLQKAHHLPFCSHAWKHAGKRALIEIDTDSVPECSCRLNKLRADWGCE